jgi:hypothetical protein
MDSTPLFGLPEGLHDITPLGDQTHLHVLHGENTFIHIKHTLFLCASAGVMNSSSLGAWT